MKRTITGLSLFAVLMGVIMLTEVSRYFFDVLVLVFAGLSLYEMIDLGKRKEMTPEIIPLAIIMAAIYPMILFFGMKGYIITAGAGFLLIFGFYVFDQKVEFKNFSYTLFVMLYVILSLSLTFWLNREYGMLPILVAVGAAMCSDTVAYYLGSLIKGPKIFPKISPKKTYSGSIAGLFGGALGSYLVYLLFELLNLPVYDKLRFTDYFNPHLFYLLIGVAIAVISEIGDLGASRIKRSLEIKDFSKLLGSHGGVMDRLDSIIFALIFMSAVMAFAV